MIFSDVVGPAPLEPAPLEPAPLGPAPLGPAPRHPTPGEAYLRPPACGGPSLLLELEQSCVPIIICSL